MKKMMMIIVAILTIGFATLTVSASTSKTYSAKDMKDHKYTLTADERLAVTELSRVKASIDDTTLMEYWYKKLDGKTCVKTMINGIEMSYASEDWLITYKDGKASSATYKVLVSYEDGSMYEVKVPFKYSKDGWTCKDKKITCKEVREGR